ncbi:MAG: penicillin-binding protein activator LpoB [Salinispira sp.]
MKQLLILCSAFFFLASCSSVQVTRTDADTVTDLSGRWNDIDSKLVAEEMISDSLSRPWRDQFHERENRAPVLIVGSIRNRSSEHIETRVFTKDIEREFINSGLVSLVASAEERGEIRGERVDQQSEANLESLKRIGQETGADYIIIGTISSVTDQIEGTKAILYQVDMELIHIETNIKAWIGSKEIKKIIERAEVRF